jgi:hypothetical protein
MTIPPITFKLAAAYLSQQMEQMQEPAEQPEQERAPMAGRRSVLSLLGKEQEHDTATASEASPKIVTDSAGKKMG